MILCSIVAVIVMIIQVPCHLWAGRQHQLRVHTDYIGHTIVGDYTYSMRQDVQPPRMMLHAHRLAVDIHQEPLDLHTDDPFTSELLPAWEPSDVCRTYQQAETIAEGFDIEDKSSVAKCGKFRHVFLESGRLKTYNT